MPKKSLLWKIFSLVLIVSVIVGLSISLVLVRNQIQSLERALIYEIETLLRTLSITIEAGVKMDILPLKVLKQVGDEERIVFLWIVKPDGRIFYADNVEMWAKKIDDPFLGTRKLAHRDALDPTTGEKIKIFAAPLIMEPLLEPWTLFLGVSIKEIIAAQKKAIVSIFSLLLIFILLFSIISFYLIKRIIRPLEELRKGIEIFRKGDFNYRIQIKTGDEIEELANSFNQMAENLSQFHTALEEAKTVLEIRVQARTRELRELAENLEEQVKERTKALQAKIAELERFQKLAVGRELKMIELKKEIRRLQEELKKQSKAKVEHQ